jgi:hypothetical protein
MVKFHNIFLHLPAARLARFLSLIKTTLAGLILSAARKEIKMTDYDRIKNAFRELENRGFVAEMDISIDQSSAWGEIEDESPEAEDVIFYHAQSAEDIGDAGDLESPMYLYHRGRSAMAIDVLNDCGLNASWNGREDTAILIRGRRNLQFPSEDSED